MTMTRPGAVALRLAAVVDSSDDAILSESLDGIIDSWNRAASELFGYSAARRLTARVHGGESVGHFRTDRQRRNGQLVPVSLVLSPIRSPEGDIAGVSTIARNISAQLVAEREALRLAAIVDSSEDAIVSKDLSGTNALSFAITCRASA